jgi:hypothetical protein
MSFRRPTAILVVLAASAALTTSRPDAQQPSPVRGRVAIGIPIATKRATNAYSRTIQEAKLAPVSELRNVVVYLKDAPKRTKTSFLES